MSKETMKTPSIDTTVLTMSVCDFINLFFILGWLFVLSNRVENLEQQAETLSRLLPEKPCVERARDRRECGSWKLNHERNIK
jgi:hypothetical protein